MYVLDKVKADLKSAIGQAVAAAGLAQAGEQPEIVLEMPKEKAHGDFSTNIAMQLTRIARKNPRQIADSLLQHLDNAQAGVAKVEVAGPGFINFFMDKSFLYSIIGEIVRSDESYGRVNMGNGRRVQVEFVSANPTGSLHLGHARGAAVGDALCNLLSYAGFDVSREYYINDAGNQVFNLAKSIEARYMQQLGQEAVMPEDGYYGEDIKEFAQQLANQEGDSLLRLPEEQRTEFFRSYGLSKELEKIKRDLERFRVRFDHWFSESSLYGDGQIDAVLQELTEKGHIYRKEGAVWLQTMPFGDDKDRVLVKNDGSYTYLTPDIAYHRNKFVRGFDHLINIWGADHHGYIPRVKAAMATLGYDPSRLTVLIAQMVSLYQNGEKVKMSKRTGKAITMEDLMEEVGVDAVRYFFTMRSIDSHLDFDMDLALEKSNENPVFYVQYAHARICSIFRQAEEQQIARLPVEQVKLNVLQSEPEYDLLQKIGEFPEEIRIAAEQYAPHRIIRYVYELAALFHSYYKAERVITDDGEQTQARLALLEAIRSVIRNALRLVGVSAPDRM
jgi:arginyl-tRNA synthetase